MDSSAATPLQKTSPATDLAGLAARLADARSSDSPAREVLVQDLETAYEELRVADEEIRIQHDAIQRLVASHQGLRLQHERTMAVLPVPVVVTDMRGIIRSVNAAAAMLVAARVSRLIGKPVFSLFSTSDRPDLRRLLSTRGRDGQVMHQTATVLTRAGEALSVEVTACVQFPGAGDSEISWILLSGHERREPSQSPVPLAESLTELAMLTQSDATRAEVLHAAVRICREALGTQAEATVVLGSPLEPTEVFSSSQDAQAWDGAQISCGEGPSETSYRDGVTTITPDLRTDCRWPRLARCLPDGDRGVAATPIKRSDRVVGTMTVYATGGPADLEDVIEVFGVTLGGLLHELELREEISRLEEDMRRALASRAVLDQAKGIVMAARGVSAEEAWEHLVHLSATEHVKVRDVAERIVAGAGGQD